MLKDKKRLSIIVIIVMLIVGVIICVTIVKKEKRRSLYEQCVGLVLEGNWQDTIDTLQELAESDYEASDTFYTFCTALKYFDEGNIEDAYDVTHHMYFTGATHEQRLKMLEYCSAVREAYERKYGVQYSFPPSSSPGSSNNNSSPSNSSSGSSNSSRDSNTSSGSNRPSATDPYNISDYDDVDDFYEDYYYDFEDFDEAEEYWDENH